MQVLIIFHVLIAIAMVALVLVQKGAGATAGAAFGSGASGTVFGSRGAGNFLTRSTWVLATLFCALSLTMAVVVSRSTAEVDTDLGVVAGTPAPEAQTPAAETNAFDQPASEESDLPAVDGDSSGANDMTLDGSDDLPMLDEPTGLDDAAGDTLADLPAEADEDSENP